MKRSQDYFPALESTMRFPFVLYHGPLRRHVLRGIAAEARRRGRPLALLNVGCGLSQVLEAIDPRHPYLGVDIDPRSVEACRARYASREARFLACDPDRLPADDGAFDVVFSTEVIEHVGDPRAWLLELVRVTAPGGLILLSTPNYGDLPLPLIERTFLELVARFHGFTRKGIHPMPFSRDKLHDLLHAVGLDEPVVAKTPGRLALIASARKPAGR
ncbi:MAG: class I SAM-dependent methyltransferase [Myxococcales bacterium]|nr:class I SAM-dependent methyltransferase [Myxococcales bacterium]